MWTIHVMIINTLSLALNKEMLICKFFLWNQTRVDESNRRFYCHIVFISEKKLFRNTDFLCSYVKSKEETFLCCDVRDTSRHFISLKCMNRDRVKGLRDSVILFFFFFFVIHIYGQMMRRQWKSNQKTDLLEIFILQLLVRMEFGTIRSIQWNSK